MNWYFPNGSLSVTDRPLSLSAERAGWTYCGIEVYDMSRTPKIEFTFTDREAVVVPLSALSINARVDGANF